MAAMAALVIAQQMTSAAYNIVQGCCSCAVGGDAACLAYLRSRGTELSSSEHHGELETSHGELVRSNA
jgi:hypothetical protein